MGKMQTKVDELASFIDYLFYQKKWKAASIGTVLGGLNTVFTLHHWEPLPTQHKLIALHLKGLARSEPVKAKGGAIVPH